MSRDMKQGVKQDWVKLSKFYPGRTMKNTTQNEMCAEVVFGVGCDLKCDLKCEIGCSDCKSRSTVPSCT